MKNYYYAIMSTDKETGKEYSRVLKVNESMNLLHIIENEKKHGAIIIQQAATKKRAAEIAHFWNDCSMKNGRYMFDKHYF